MNQILSVDVSEEGNTTIVRLEGTSAPVFTVFKLERPERLSVDIANAELGDLPNLVTADTWAVSQVLAAQYRTDKETTARVVVGLQRMIA